MDIKRLMIAIVSLAASAHVASASPCGDQVAAYAKKIEGLGHKAVAANSGGQAVAAERDAKAQTGETSSAAGDANAFMSAKMALNDADVAARKGDETACAANLAKARHLAEPRS